MGGWGAASAEERLARVLARLLAVPREDLESTYIVTGQPLSSLIPVLGVGAEEAKVVDLSDPSALGVLATAMKEREMHAQQPLSSIAEPLGIEVRVRFYEVNGIPVYFVEEPKVDDLALRVYAYLRLRISETGIEGGNVLRMATETFRDLGLDARTVLSIPGVKAGVYYVWRDLVGYGPLEVMMEDPMVEEISWYSYDGPVLVVDKEVADKYPNAEFTYTNVFIPPTLDDETRKFVMSQIVRVMVNRARVGLTIARPLAEARIPDPTGRGFHRLAAHLEVVGRSPGLTIRKFPQYKLSITKLIDLGTLSELEAAYLIYQLLNRGFVLIVGGMASGKSLHRDSLVLAKVNGWVELTTVEGLWNELLRRGGKAHAAGNMEVIDLSGADVEVLTLARSGVEWRRPRFLIRHRVSEKLVKIRTNTGRELVVTKDHSLLVWKVGSEKDRFAVDIAVAKPTEVVAKQTYLPYLRRLSLEGAGAQGRAADPRFGYLVGFFVAEGSFHSPNVPRLYQAVGGVLDTALRYASELGMQIRVAPEKRRPNMRYISVYDADFRRLVADAGENARSKRVPGAFWNMPEEWRCAFLAGVIDGDGSVDARKYIIEVSTASRELAYGLLYAFASVGVHAYVREKRVKKYPDRTYYRVFVPIGINKEGLAKIAKYLSEEKRKLIEEAVARSGNHHSETDVIPAEVAYAIGAQLKRLAHGGNGELSLELRGYEYKGENPSYYRVERLLGEKLYDFVPRGVGFDRVESVEEVDYDGYVYDVEVPETENFEANGIFVHNTTLLQALLSALPVSYKVITVEDTPELSTPSQNWHPLYTRTTMGETELENIDYSRLVIHSLRHRGTIVTLGEVRGAEMSQLIQAAASGHGAACTFHAYDPFTVLSRITSPPISVSPANLKLITSMVFLARTKTFAYGEPRAVRRVLHVYEIEDVTSEGVRAPTVFDWDPATDTHRPDLFDREFEAMVSKGDHEGALRKVVDALARLWVSSRSTRTFGLNAYGEDEPERALADIFVLASFLYAERRAGVFDIRSLSNDLTSFYLRMYERSAAAWDKLRGLLVERIEELKKEGAR